MQRNESGNTLAIMAMAMFPLAGLVGGGVDMSRMYLTKSRLQQACDAGALAGRKVMGGGAWAANSNAAQTSANEFFDGNFQSGAYGTKGMTRAFSEAAGKVTGTASATVPMTIMRIFGSREQTLTVTCDAEMRLPNTDVMFVLDTTGSMDETLPGDTEKKIVVLRRAVKCFYETLARLDTTAVCGTGAAPSGGTSAGTQIRFGFVPYSTNVNVGRSLPTSYFANSWEYQSREAKKRPQTTYFFNSPNGTPTITATRQENQSPSTNDANTYTLISQTTKANDAACQSSKPADTTPVSTGSESAAPAYAPSSGTTSTRTDSWETSQPYRQQYQYGALYTGGQCYVGRRIITYTLMRTYSRTDTGTPQTVQVFDKWRYNKMPVDISALKAGTNWRSSFTYPIGDTSEGAQVVSVKTINWDGCIEERETAKLTDYTSMTIAEKSKAKDLNIDLVPNASDATTLWGPALHDLIYVRKAMEKPAASPPDTYLDASEIGEFALGEELSAANFFRIDNNGTDSYFCPREAKKLQSWPTASTFESYVDALTPAGNTYHDIGLLWGARFISPTGIFASENATTPGGGEIQRHLIFMTDGQTCTGAANYGPYGLPWFDRRQTDDTLAPTAGCSSTGNTGGTLTEQVDARFKALCTSAKNKNLTLWVIYFGSTDADTTTRMTNCATDATKFKPAANAAALTAAFASIAQQISQLRLTQ